MLRLLTWLVEKEGKFQRPRLKKTPATRVSRREKRLDGWEEDLLLGLLRFASSVLLAISPMVCFFCPVYAEAPDRATAAGGVFFCRKR